MNTEMNTKLKKSFRRIERRSIYSKSLDSIFTEHSEDEEINNNVVSNLSCLQVFDIIGLFEKMDSTIRTKFMNSLKSQPCFLMNQQGQLLYVNEEWCKLCEYNASECIGKNLGFLQGLETNKADVYAFLNQIYNNSDAELNVCNYTKSGNEIHINVKSYNLGSLYSSNNVQNGNVPFFMSFVESYS